MKSTGLAVFLYILSFPSWAQKDTATGIRSLAEVVVTASRTTRQQDSLPVAVTIIRGKDIRDMGSRRLVDVLREQAGLVIATDEHGSGLQMQGLDPDYTMILLDGQPLIGRLTGKLDLNRITVANIERIEIIKGASSSLYGSEALAGVINIITSTGGATPKGDLSVRTGNYGLLETSASGYQPFAGGKGGFQWLGDYYRTNGYSLSSGQAPSLPPFYSYTLQGRGTYHMSDRSDLQLSGRYGYRYQHTVYDFSGNDPEKDATGEKDWNISAVWRYTGSSRWKSRLEYYLSSYHTDEKIKDLNTGKENDTSFFRQNLHRLEWQHDYNISRELLFTGGVGGNLESVIATRYPRRETMQSGYIYLQQQYNPGRRWNITGGLRGDLHNVYGSLLSPKAAAQFHAGKKLSFKASLGRGFKAPDFRQLYLTFTNPLVGYTVLGTEEVKAGALLQMQEAGEITNIYPAASQAAADLKAEKSWSYNAGVVFEPLSSIRLEWNFFYNSVNNLIQSIPIADKTNGWFVYSYRNVSKVYTEGLEFSGRWLVGRDWEVQAGYQLLYARDRDILDSIRAGTGSYATITDPVTGHQRRATVKDYFGLDQRSRHQANIRLFYRHPQGGWRGSLRLSYLSPSGFNDLNGNGYIDHYDQFAPAYAILSFSLEKSLLKDRLALQASVDNITGYTNALIAGQPGRQYSGGLRWNWIKTKQTPSLIKNK